MSKREDSGVNKLECAELRAVRGEERTTRVLQLGLVGVAIKCTDKLEVRTKEQTLVGAPEAL